MSLVTIDTENRDHALALWKRFSMGVLADDDGVTAMQQALREFAQPTPPSGLDPLRDLAALADEFEAKPHVAKWHGHQLIRALLDAAPTGRSDSAPRESEGAEHFREEVLTGERGDCAANDECIAGLNHEGECRLPSWAAPVQPAERAEGERSCGICGQCHVDHEGDRLLIEWQKDAAWGRGNAPLHNPGCPAPAPTDDAVTVTDVFVDRLRQAEGDEVVPLMEAHAELIRSLMDVGTQYGADWWPGIEGRGIVRAVLAAGYSRRPAVRVHSSTCERTCLGISELEIPTAPEAVALTRVERGEIARAGDHHPETCDCSVYAVDGGYLEHDICTGLAQTFDAVERIIAARLGGA